MVRFYGTCKERRRAHASEDTDRSEADLCSGGLGLAQRGLHGDNLGTCVRRLCRERVLLRRRRRYGRGALRELLLGVGELLPQLAHRRVGLAHLLPQPLLLHQSLRQLPASTCAARTPLKLTVTTDFEALHISQGAYPAGP